MIVVFEIENMGDYLSKVNELQYALTNINGKIPHIWFRGQASKVFLKKLLSTSG